MGADLDAHCIVVGPRIFNPQTINVALGGRYDHGTLSAHPVQVSWTGDNGVRHFHHGCPPLLAGSKRVNPSPTRALITLSELDAIIHSRRHQCIHDYHSWLDHDTMFQLSALHDAHTLTTHWHHAAAATQRHGRLTLPDDNTPIETGALRNLCDQVDNYQPDNDIYRYGPEFPQQLRDDMEAWEAVHQHKDTIEASDPHRQIIDWQTAGNLPQLHGSPKQIRWAEHIRHTTCTASDDNFDAFMFEHFQHETSAAAIIGEHMHQLQHQH